MTTPILAASRRTRRTPFSPRVEAHGVKGYTVYNHMLLATVFNTVEEDYRHLKSRVQVWDVGCERQVEVSGPDAARLIQLMTPRNMDRVVIGQCAYAPLVDETGAMINDPVVLKLAEDRFWISIADSDVVLWAKGLAYGMGLSVEIFEPAVWPLAIQGPLADDLTARVFGEEVRAIRFFRFAELEFHGHSFVVARSGWSKQGGFEVYVDDAEIGLALYDALFAGGEDLDVRPGCPNLIERIEGGLFSYGNDMTIENNPFECGLDKFCNLDAGIEFIGREALQQLQAQGGAQRVIRGVTFEGDNCPACVEAWPVTSGGQHAGHLTSAAHSPDFGTNIGFAMIERFAWEPGTEVTVETPLGPHTGRVSALPFER
ncbi:MAG: dimethylsulfoniopropionate demethylase [Alphaproteobacteria bacterium]|nr:dimethylsulfoniopropionate demethylase [Rhodospirillaceae bacterium]MDG2482360.1 dimethylsulfoniopropionate demethylase [Alphaproteobacteria bacterium]MBT6205533.1 dimethylsulfoniopropionate demethylase [Rhodospirillaceae bacterium]MBT6512708.1 dimethylsulfoniopropionate demethylase [Rhodospirillaceae bacterium]MBT7612286.1 dimethylsulfoniopropionate demethylase [Rhodospirillaceae bacterium]